MFQTTNQFLKVVYPFIKLTIKPAILAESPTS